MRNLRVLMVGDGFKPAIGGAETVNYELSRRLVERGHAVTVLTRRTNGAWPRREIVDGVEVRRYDDPLLPRPFVYFAFDLPDIVRAKRAFEALLADQRFDVIVLHPVVSPLGACLSRRAGETPKLLVYYAPSHLELEAEFGDKGSSRGRWRPPMLRNFLLRLKVLEKKTQQRQLMGRATTVVVFSNYSVQTAKALAPSLPAEKVRLLPIGVDTETFRPLAGDQEEVRRRLGLARGQFVLFTLRRLVPRMGLDNLLRSLPKVLAEIGEACLVVGGEGPLRPALDHLAAELDLGDRVRFLGRLKNEEMVQYYQASDLFVLPSRSLEGIGLPTLESLACGLPVLGTPVGATPEILGKLSPKLLTRGTEPDDIAEGIVQFIRSFGPANQELRARCRQLAEKEYAWPKAVDEFEKLLAELVEAKGRAADIPSPSSRARGLG